MSDPPVVMVVEDEPDVAESYQLWLQGEYDVRWADNGPEALNRIDDEVDVVLLDRMMTEMSGDEVLAELRERGVDCQVAMVTAVDPGLDVLEMGFDEYLTKPPKRGELVETVERLLERADLEDHMQEYYSMVARRSALEAEFTEAELADSEQYVALTERIESHGAAVDEELGDMSSDEEFVGVVREIENADPKTGEGSDDGWT